MAYNSLLCFCNFYRNDWDHLLPKGELANKSAVKESVPSDLSWNPKPPLNLFSSSEVSNEIARLFKDSSKANFGNVRHAY